MNLKEYQEFTKKTVVYPPEVAVEYLIFGLVSEAGEVAGKFKKYLRGDNSFTECSDKLSSELGDLLWYLVRLCDELQIEMDDLIDRNVQKLSKRLKENKIHGDGDER